MANLLLKDGVLAQYPCTMEQLQDDFLDDGVFVTMDAKLPYEREDRDGSVYLLLVPKSKRRPTADFVKEIDPELLDGEWVQAYESRDFTVAEVDSYRVKANARLLTKQNAHADKGIMVNDIRIGTTPGAVADLMGAYEGTRRNPTRVRKVNLAGGKTTLREADLLGIIGLVDDHRQGCHDKGYDISELLDAAGTKTEIDEIINDPVIMGDWPGDTP